MPMNYRKMFSLKKGISRIVAAFIGIVLMVILVVLVTMVIHYQIQQNDRRMDEVTAYAQKLDENLVQMNAIVGDIYASNSDFQTVDMYLPVSKKWGSIYALQNLCRFQVRSNQSLCGLFVYYHDLLAEKDREIEDFRILYFLNETVPFSDMETTKAEGRKIVEHKDGDYASAVIPTENENYYGIYLTRNFATVGGLIKLSNGLPDERNEEAVFGVIHEDVFYRTAGNAESGLSYEDCKNLKTGRNRLRDKIVYRYDLDVANMSVVEILPRNLWTYINGLHILMCLLCAAFIAFSVYLYRFVTRELTVPLEDMNHAMQQIGIGKWEIAFEAPNRISEIENVRQTVRTLLGKIEQYKITTYEERLKRQKTQLQYLQLQLAPHFFTNCLKNIYYMLLLKEYECTEQVVLGLAKHLRYLLQRDVTMVTVGQERDFIVNYIELQKRMNESSIICELLIDETALDCKIPILALQTFVENSVKYAGGSGKDDLDIRVIVRKQRADTMEFLYIAVSDNGTGYPEEVLEMLNQNEPMENPGLGVGITNLLNRICIQYGSDARWHFCNEGGAFNELYFPREDGKEEK